MQYYIIYTLYTKHHYTAMYFGAVQVYLLYRCCVQDRKRQSFSGVWLIAVLLINPTFHTTFSILQCPRVEKGDDRWVNVSVIVICSNLYN